MQHTSFKSAHFGQFNASCFVSPDYIREMQSDVEKTDGSKAIVPSGDSGKWVTRSPSDHVTDHVTGLLRHEVPEEALKGRRHSL